MEECCQDTSSEYLVVPGSNRAAAVVVAALGYSDTFGACVLLGPCELLFRDAHGGVASGASSFRAHEFRVCKNMLVLPGQILIDN